MRLAIDAESLISVFNGENGNLEDAVRSSIISVTENILDDYDEKVFLDGSGMSHQWLKRIYDSPDRLRAVSDEELISYGLANTQDLDSNYIGAAFLNGQLLIRGSSSEAALTLARKYGVKVITTDDKVDFKKLDGHNVIRSHTLNSSTKHKHNIIRNYFNQETEVIIYDRYLKESSILLLENVLPHIGANATVSVISEFEKYGVPSKDVKNRLQKAAPRRTINCYYPDFEEQSDKHDRHIHLGQRFQLTFTSGLDCFGSHPTWNNSECDIQVFYLGPDCSTRDYVVADRPALGRSFKIRAFSKNAQS